MEVYLLKDVAKIGIAGEIIKVKDGFAQNFLFPQKLAVQVTPDNEKHYRAKVKKVEHRKEALESETSMLGEKIKDITITLKRTTHDDGKLYSSINPYEIVEALAEKGIAVSKSQVQIDKSIKSTGSYKVTIKLSSRLKPTLNVKVVSEKS